MGNSKTKPNVIIDTNVIVSALLSSHDDSATVQVMNLVYDNKLNLYYSDKIIDEYENVLRRPKFDFELEMITTILEFIKQKGIKINPKGIDELLVDIKDMPFFEIVMDDEIEDARLITGNLKHFPKNSMIITPSEFLDYYNSIDKAN